MLDNGTEMDRRHFIKLAALAAGGASFAGGLSLSL
jgi:hypothetical protein